MTANLRFISLLLIFIFLVSACTPTVKPFPTVEDVENVIRVIPAETKKPTDIPSTAPTASIIAPTDTLVPPAVDVPALIGTSLPERPEPIGIGNYTQLKRIAQWGRGSIQGVAFTPDGKHFIAVSEAGWSIYDVDALDQPPQWVAFDQPFLFDEFYFSNDGSLVKFQRSDYKNTETYIKKFPTADSQEAEPETSWLKPDVDREYSDINIQSPDKTKVFKSSLVYEFNEKLFSEEKTLREMYDADGNLLYSLRDDAPYVSYSDRNGPEGCDLSVFSPCGNALMAVATAPAKVLFSPNGKTFAILYDPPSLYSGILKAFSYIRIYDSTSGKLIGSLGGFTKPVQDFSYSPDGSDLVVGFVDGSLVLWDIKNARNAFGARHMNAPIDRVEYSNDSKYLLIQRGDEVEVRLTSNGNLLYRFDAVDFAVSPAGSLAAFGEDDGTVRIRNLDTGKGVREIKAHQDRIYSLAFSPDGNYLASSGRDCDIKLWDAKTGKLLHYFEETTVDAYEIDEPSRIFSTYLKFIPNTNMLVGFGSWGTVVNWNVDSGATNYVIQSDALQYYNGMITLKPHFPEFFTVDEANNRFYINENRFDLTSGEGLGVYQIPANLPEGCSPVGPRSRDQKLLFTLGVETHDGQVCVLNAESLELLNLIPAPWANWLYLSPDGKQLIITAGSGILYVVQVV